MAKRAIRATVRAIPVRGRVPPARAQFRALLLGNPNYFGNVATSPFKAVNLIVSDTAYEELTCVGLNPEFDRLEAVVLVKQDVGYEGGVCTAGSQEYVRFYLSYDGGGTWQDQGIAAFATYDIPGPKPLEYAVTLRISPEKRPCFVENLVLVRAILSWNNPPPAGQPDFPPVWGNVLQSRVQIGVSPWILLADIFKLAKLPIPKVLPPGIDLAKPIPAAEPITLGLVDLAAAYQAEKVPAHRFAFAEVQKLITGPELTPSLSTPGFPGVLAELDLDVATLIGQLLPIQGDTQYEELDCIGLDPNLETLVAVVSVKLPYGYSGGLCTRGSKEFVAFWIDWGTGGGWTYAGTTSVGVHDLPGVPPAVSYAAFLPVDMSGHRQPCEMGPRLAKVRAVLSWQLPPPPSNPDYLPTWGNRHETEIQIRPGPPPPPPGTHPPFIETVGNMAVSSIDPTTGLAYGPAVGAGFTAAQSPFGAEIVITGHIAYPPDILGGGAAPLKYRVRVSSDNGATWQLVTNNFTIWLTQLLNGVWTGPVPVVQSVDPVLFGYDYREDLTDGPGNPMQFVAENVLARWQTGAPMSGLWLVKLEVLDPVNPANVWASNVVRVCLDNDPPKASITITSGGGPCADFRIGDPLQGTYAATDAHFGWLRLSVQPMLGGQFTSPPSAPGPSLMPLVRTFPTVPTGGESGSWSLNTSLMPRCGYVVYLEVRDRTIVGSGWVGLYASANVGLCLRE